MAKVAKRGKTWALLFTIESENAVGKSLRQVNIENAIMAQTGMSAKQLGQPKVTVTSNKR